MTGDCCKCDPSSNTWISWFSCSFKFKTLVTASTALVAGVGAVFTLYPEQTKKALFWTSAAVATAFIAKDVYTILPKVTYSQEREVTILEGINFINLQDGESFISASLCKLSKSFTIINNFNAEQGHLKFSCSQKIDLSFKDASVDHYWWWMTVLNIKGNETISTIYFLGDVNIQPEKLLFPKKIEQPEEILGKIEQPEETLF